MSRSDKIDSAVSVLHRYGYKSEGDAVAAFVEDSASLNAENSELREEVHTLRNRLAVAGAQGQNMQPSQPGG